MSGAYDPNNIFTKIIAGELPSHKVYEDDVCVSIMDIMPESRGHILVIPKQGSRNLLDVEPEVLSSVMERVQKLAVATKHAMNADGILLRQSSEEVAGQTVYHLHFHIIPRWSDQPLRGHAAGEMADIAQLEAIAEQIRPHIA